MLRSIALLALLVGTSAYSPEAACADNINFVTCSIDATSSSEATCTASPAGCQWIVDEDDSSTSCMLKDPDDCAADFMSAQMVKGTVDAICSVNGETDCYNTCFWDALNENCVASLENVAAALLLAGHNPGTVAMQTVLVTGGTICSVDVASCTDPKCAVYDGECSVAPLFGLGVFQQFCPEDPALANLEGAMSGANAAAPALVIISALVGALAIFA